MAGKTPRLIPVLRVLTALVPRVCVRMARSAHAAVAAAVAAAVVLIAVTPPAVKTTASRWHREQWNPVHPR
jgi:hypothetical protein